MLEFPQVPLGTGVFMHHGVYSHWTFPPPTLILWFLIIFTEDARPTTRQQALIKHNFSVSLQIFIFWPSGHLLQLITLFCECSSLCLDFTICFGNCCNCLQLVVLPECMVSYWWFEDWGTLIIVLPLWRAARYCTVLYFSG